MITEYSVAALRRGALFRCDVPVDGGASQDVWVASAIPEGVLTSVFAARWGRVLLGANRPLRVGDVLDASAGVAPVQRDFGVRRAGGTVLRDALPARCVVEVRAVVLDGASVDAACWGLGVSEEGAPVIVWRDPPPEGTAYSVRALCLPGLRIGAVLSVEEAPRKDAPTRFVQLVEVSVL